MERAGFVLAGGRSSRMGRDKALLRVGELTLVERTAASVREAAGNVTLIGPPDRYGDLGIAIVADKVDGCGPLGGLFTALSTTAADWNLIVACDMPGVTAGLLREMLDAAERCERRALVPWTGEAFEPLCAVYHRSLLPEVARAIDHKFLKMQDFVSKIDAARWTDRAGAAFANLNTPEDWAAFAKASSRGGTG